MKRSGFLIGLLGISGLALLAGCATGSMAPTARAAPPATYAIVAVDNQGVMSAAAFRKIEVGVVQYLLDQGYVRAEDKYVTNVVTADVVFRVRIAWVGAHGGFSVTEVEPSFSARPYAETATGAAAATPYVPWYAAGGWYDNPWWYDDGYGPAFWPFAGFAGLSALAPIYARGREGHREPDHDDRHGGDHDRRAWDHDHRHAPDRDDWSHDGRADCPDLAGARDRSSTSEHSTDRWRGAGRPAPTWWQEHRQAAAGGFHRSHRSAPALVRPRSDARPIRSYSPPPPAFAAPAPSYAPPRAPRPAERNADHDRRARP